MLTMFLLLISQQHIKIIKQDSKLHHKFTHYKPQITGSGESATLTRATLIRDQRFVGTEGGVQARLLTVLLSRGMTSLLCVGGSTSAR